MSYQLDISDEEQGYLDGLPLSPEAKKRIHQFVEQFVADVPDEFRLNPENRPNADQPYFLVQHMIFGPLGRRPPAHGRFPCPG